MIATPAGSGGTAAWSRSLARLYTMPRAWLGGVIVLVFLTLAVAAWSGLLPPPWAGAEGGYNGPGPDHWLGTNRLGQDLLLLGIHGAASAFELAVPVAAGAVAIGGILGAAAGWMHRRWLDWCTLWLANVVEALPFYLFAAAVALALGEYPWSAHLAMLAAFWTPSYRLVRAQVLRLRQAPYLLAAWKLGCSNRALLQRHILPNTAPIWLVQFSILFIAAIKTEVILTFLGLGPAVQASWGTMLTEGTEEVLAGHFGNFLVASVMLFVLAWGMHLLSDALQQATEPA